VSATRLVVFAWGNDSRGDDALGPAFLASATAQADPPGVTTTFVGDWQLQPEHMIDLDCQDLALFVDASRDALPPYAFGTVVPTHSPTFTTHGMTPGAVLDAFHLMFDRAPPPAFVLAIRGEHFGLGLPLGPAARNNLEAALDFFAHLRAHASPAQWQSIAADLGATAQPTGGQGVA
jgi:hydrogenase maturation protease